MIRSVIQELRECEEDYLLRVHDIVSNLAVQSKPEPVKKKLKTFSSTAAASSEADSNTMHISSHDDNHQESSSLEIGKNADENADSGDDEIDEDDADGGNFWSKPKEGIPLLSMNAPDTKPETLLVIPTTEELRHQIQDPKALLQIALLRREARQMTEEQLSNAHQTYAIVDDAIKKLDADLEKFETLLKTTGQYETMIATSGAQPDDLAAIQVSPNSPDWILAKVISHDDHNGMYTLSDEDIESNKSAFITHAFVVGRLRQFHLTIHSFILLSAFTLPESQVVILGGVDKVNRGEIIYGVYPDTTSFYQATVVEMPKKIPGKDVLVLVHFKDDGDENGITHAKAVPMKHVMKVPYGAIQ